MLPPAVPLPRKAEWDHVLTALLLGVASFLIAFPTRTGLIGVATVAFVVVLLIRQSRRATADALARIAAGKPARRCSWSILGESIILENIGEAIRAALRRRRRKGLVRRVRTP